MNELQVKTIEMKPAVIEFNHENIEKELQESLKKYDGLTFTSDASTELRSTLAELRKGKKAVDEYRKKIKRELNQPVLEFEEKCKSLNKYFDEVINPLDEQLKTFVEQERAEKLEKLEIARDEYIEKHELNEEFAEQVEIKDRFLTKSVSLKSASESIEFQVKNLKEEQNRLENDKKVLTQSVEMANERNDLGFSADAYIRLLEFDDLATVHAQLNKDVDKEFKRRAEKERQEKERAEQEHIKQQKKEKFDGAMKKVEEVVNDTSVDAIAKENEEIIGVPFEPLDDPFESMDDPFAEVDNLRRYELTGTEGQFEELEKAFKNIGLEWVEIE